jgi:glycosyltransferase involved in cell wall biosynthesis
MKIYSYLHSGKPLVATAIPSHTQVLNDEVARLCEPNADDFAQGLVWAITNRDEARKMGERARQLAEERYTFSVFKENLLKLYDMFGEN